VIGPSYTQCIAIQLLQLCYDLFVDETTINHGHEIACRCVSYSPAIHIVRLNAQLIPDFGSYFSSTVYQYLRRLYGSKIFEELAQCRFIIQYVASNLDDV